jgi:hypothetical protein
MISDLKTRACFPVSTLHRDSDSFCMQHLTVVLLLRRLDGRQTLVLRFSGSRNEEVQYEA